MSADEERRRAAAINSRVRADVDRRGVRGPRDEWILAEVSRAPAPVPPIVAASIPAHFARTCPGPLLDRLRALLLEVDGWASGLVGLDDVESSALYNGDPLAMVLRDEVCAWALDYAQVRLSRPSPKDQGDPFRKWMRLQVEYLEWLEATCLRPGVAVALSELPDRVAHRIWTETVGRELRAQRVDGGFLLDFGGLRREWAEAVKGILDLYGWHEVDALARARARFTSLAEGDPALLTRRRLAMAEDIVEARALLVGPDDPVAPVDVPGGTVGFWWGLQHSAGVLLTGPDRAALDEQISSGHLGGPLRIHLDGHLSGQVTWWDEGGDPAWEVPLVEAVHRPLVEAWLARAPGPPPAEEPRTAEAAVAAVAEANQRIAEPVEGRSLPAVRMQTLLGLLERRFGCEVGSGKGSEVTVYRPGGRKFTIGRHTRNRHVPAHVVRALLRAVGVSVTEWWRVLDA